jgi:hypothetical protein
MQPDSPRATLADAAAVLIRFAEALPLACPAIDLGARLLPFRGALRYG